MKPGVVASNVETFALIRLTQPRASESSSVWMTISLSNSLYGSMIARRQFDL